MCLVGLVGLAGLVCLVGLVSPVGLVGLVLVGRSSCFFLCVGVVWWVWLFVFVLSFMQK